MKTALITGADSGIGLAVSQGLISLGWRVLMVCRNEEAAFHTQKRIEGYADGTAHCFACDLMVPHEVQALCENVSHLLANQAGGRLDAIVCNAGICWPSQPVNEIGIESCTAVNCLSHLLLFDGLKDSLEAVQGRIIFSSDSLYQFIRNALPDDFFQSTGCSFLRRYARSKLGMQWLRTALQASYPHLSFYAVDPTFTYTDFYLHNAPACLKPFLRLIRRFGISAGKAAGTYIGLLQSDSPLPVGNYVDRKYRSASALALDFAKANQFLTLLRAVTDRN